MGEKRALIVDDSKSARLFLTRILEKYGIVVESVESAEAAITYLQGQRPDVIFMDHLMPGMDGFQAVHAIKTDPRTATIPIMMYTSQEGEVYLGQARALGAVGVLPKQIAPADVSKVLYQLHLVPDRRSDAQSSFRPVELGRAAELSRPGAPHVASNTQQPQTSSASRAQGSAAAPRAGPLAPVVSARAAGPDQPLREQIAELRHALTASQEAQTERMLEEVRALARTPRDPDGTRAWVAALAAAAIVLAGAMASLWWRERAQLASASAELTLLRQAIAARATPATAGAAATAGAPATALSPASNGIASRPLVLEVPYGAEALAGRRLRAIRALLHRLAADHVSGTVSIRTYAGRFCLDGDPVRGYALASPGSPFSQCAVVGNPAFDALPPEQRMPIALADLIGAISSSTHGALDVQTGIGDPANVRVPYPPITDELTAGEWNKAGRANNRIEIRVR
jgi:CheY-like chemotaxis protein